jgi:hypothetical protein
MMTCMLHWFSSCYCQEYCWNTAYVALSNIQSINSHYDKWSELTKQTIMTSQAS